MWFVSETDLQLVTEKEALPSTRGGSPVSFLPKRSFSTCILLVNSRLRQQGRALVDIRLAMPTVVMLSRVAFARLSLSL